MSTSKLGEAVLKDRVVSIPETLAEAPRRMKVEPLIHVNFKLKLEMIERLHTKSKQSGYTKQEIVDMALEAFLK